jgi:hypothetical protein
MIDRDRLSKLLGLLGSDHDGEVINAARAADRLVRDSGLRWPDIAMPAPPPPRGYRFDPIRFCLAQPPALTDWEERFLHSIKRQSYRLTPKQFGVLERIVQKVAGGRG